MAGRGRPASAKRARVGARALAGPGRAFGGRHDESLTRGLLRRGERNQEPARSGIAESELFTAAPRLAGRACFRGATVADSSRVQRLAGRRGCSGRIAAGQVGAGAAGRRARAELLPRFDAIWASLAQAELGRHLPVDEILAVVLAHASEQIGALGPRSRAVTYDVLGRRSRAFAPAVPRSLLCFVAVQLCLHLDAECVKICQKP